ncbi:hypothetical protein [Undibacterium sp. Ren11W]|uniref:hypothetical protein n=1 Tax=Undibacterium sp. Ren11W TaxID=3413045 RepID=UPI003BF28757
MRMMYPTSGIVKAAAFVVGILSFQMLRDAAGIDTNPLNEHIALSVIAIFSMIGLCAITAWIFGLGEYLLATGPKLNPGRMRFFKRLYYAAVVCCTVVVVGLWVYVDHVA